MPLLSLSVKRPHGMVYLLLYVHDEALLPAEWCRFQGILGYTTPKYHGEEQYVYFISAHLSVLLEGATNAQEPPPPKRHFNF